MSVNLREIELKEYLDTFDKTVSNYLTVLISEETLLPKTIKNKERFKFFSSFFLIVLPIILLVCYLLKALEFVYKKEWSFVDSLFTLVIPIALQLVIIILIINLQQ